MNQQTLCMLLNDSSFFQPTWRFGRAKIDEHLQSILHDAAVGGDGCCLNGGDEDDDDDGDDDDEDDDEDGQRQNQGRTIQSHIGDIRRR